MQNEPFECSFPNHTRAFAECSFFVHIQVNVNYEAVLVEGWCVVEGINILKQIEHLSNQQQPMTTRYLTTMYLTKETFAALLKTQSNIQVAAMTRRNRRATKPNLQLCSI